MQGHSMGDLHFNFDLFGFYFIFHFILFCSVKDTIA